MRKILKTISNSKFIKISGFLFLTIIPAFDFYKSIVLKLFSHVEIDRIDFRGNIIDIITGFLLGGIFLLFLQSKKEYTRVKQENERIREMLLTIHIFDNIRFAKLSNTVPTLFQNEEQNLKTILFEVFKHDLGKEYSNDEINEILDCFYRQKPKFK
jgi:hypothetical protein